MTVFKNTLYFVCSSPSVSGQQLCSYNNTNITVHDLQPNNTGVVYPFSGLLATSTTLFMEGETSISAGRELWTTTDGMTFTEIDINAGVGDSSPFQFVAFGGSVYFTASIGGVTGRELYRYTNGNVSLVADLDPGPLGSSPMWFTVVGKTLFFSAHPNGTQQELVRVVNGVSVNGAYSTVSIPNLGCCANQLTIPSDRLLFSSVGVSVGPIR